MSQTTLSELNASSKSDFVTALANIFEYSPWIAEHWHNHLAHLAESAPSIG